MVFVELVTNKTLQVEDATAEAVAATVFDWGGSGSPVVQTTYGPIYVNPEHVVAIWEPGNLNPMSSWG